MWLDDCNHLTMTIIMMTVTMTIRMARADCNHLKIYRLMIFTTNTMMGRGKLRDDDIDMINYDDNHNNDDNDKEDKHGDEYSYRER